MPDRETFVPGYIACVRVAIAEYVAVRKARDPRHGRDAEVRLAKHVLAEEKEMAERVLSSLDERNWRTWRKSLTGLSPSGTARLINDVKAAMRAAWRVHRRSLPPHWDDDLVEGLRPPEDSAPLPVVEV